MDDFDAIQNVKARYCAAADTIPDDVAAARQELAGLFTDDVTADYGMDPIRGPAALIEFLTTAIAAGSDWMIHMIGSPRIDVTGDSATGNWALAVHSRRKATGERDIYVGRYADTFRKVAGVWKIASVRFIRCE